VAVEKAGYTITDSPQQTPIYGCNALNSVSANGSEIQTTTQLTLNFNEPVSGLTASDITLSGVSGADSITKSLSGSGPSYTLTIGNVTAGGTLNVAVAKEYYTITGSPKTVIIYHYVPTFEMVWIPAGTFTMGSPTSEEDRSTNETQHQVTLSQGFYMGKYQVTQEQWVAVMGSLPSLLSSGTYGSIGDNYPVYYISWYDALVFCNKLSIAEGLSPAYRINGSTDPAVWGTVPTSSNSTWDAVTIVTGSTGYRLPTEAQWEYACRAGTTTAYNTGSNTISDNTGWYSNNSVGSSHDVGLKSPNAWGLYDMHGNVWEWCWDWYGTYSSGAQTDPTGAVSGTSRVVRGGSWGSNGLNLRSACRYANFPNYRSNDLVGFRLVRP
jgi:formylglycine-generating enzyme required for sulfatase activity